MFIDNKYRKVYNELIEKRRVNVPEGYVERHHILPRSLGGGDEASNLVKLTAREHYVAHRLLAKFTTGQARYKMLEAVVRFTTNHVRKLNFTSRDFEALRQANSEASSARNKGNQAWLHRAPDTDDDRKRKSEFAKSCKWMNDGEVETFTNEFDHYERLGYEYGRLPFSDKTLKNMKKAMAKNIGVPLAEETKQKIREAHIGREFTDEHRANLSASIKKIPKVICQHCGKATSPTNHKRWHGDNCKNLG